MRLNSLYSSYRRSLQHFRLPSPNVCPNCSSVSISTLSKACASISNPEGRETEESASQVENENPNFSEFDSQSHTKWLQRLVYSSHLEKYTRRQSYKQRIEEIRRKPKIEAKIIRRNVPKYSSIALKYADELIGVEIPEKIGKTNEEQEILDEIHGDTFTGEVQFPYKIYTDFSQVDDQNNGISGSTDKHANEPDVNQNNDESESNHLNHENEEDTSWIHKYGIPDPSVPASSIPCGGCGALLHCQDTAIPGYIPSERFKEFKPDDLRTEICQRCFFLKEHNAALNVNVSPKDYPKILSDIRNKRAMVLLMVDLIDFPCSIWPGIADIIGEKRPVILVGNKVDLIPRDAKNYLERIKEALIMAANDMGLDRTKIIHTALVSATTGYGIEDLISTIHDRWAMKGDIYIMGCTNVGKSSLFNAFLQSDLCKVKAVDLVQRATVSPWPGTTLNLLKFPVYKPDGWAMHLRHERMKTELPSLMAEAKLREFQLKQTKNPAYASLIGHVGRSFRVEPSEAEVRVLNATQDIFHVNPHSFSLPRLTRVGKWDPNDPVFAKSKWCYDTPGTVNENQILDKLLLPELMKILPKKMLEPRTFFIRQGNTLFVGGLARIDYPEGDSPIRFTVYASEHVPITMSHVDDADEVYENAIGTPVMGVPMGDEDRLSQFPALVPRDFVFEGISHFESCSDIVLSATGWVAVTADRGQQGRLTVHTPKGAGVFFRQPSLLPFMINLKGKRIRDTVAYNRHRPYVPHPLNRY